jgi:hypothetical protein
MFVEVYPGGRMGYAFTDVSAFGNASAVTDASADSYACADSDVHRPASAPHAGRPVRRDPRRADGGGA